MPTQSTGQIDQSDNLLVAGDTINLQAPSSTSTTSAENKNPVGDAASKLASPWVIIALAAAVVVALFMTRKKS